jgi:peptidoglycan/LPS O-acetylase OafA/YrhL
LGWGFSSGADVAWVTDELDRPDRIARVLTARARWDLVGGATGMVAFGVLGWAAGLATAIVVSGVAMALLGVFVAARFAEENFIPTREQRWSASRSIFRRGVSLARGDHEILFVLAATMMINGASMVAWLFPKQLVDQGFPDDPVLWYTALGILAFAVGVLALRIVEARIDGAGVARRIYAASCFIGVLGLILLASAPDALIGSIGVLLASGIAFNVTRAVSVIWGEPAYHERRPGDRALVPLPSRVRRRNRQRLRARGPRAGSRRVHSARHRRCTHRARRRDGRPITRRPHAVLGACATVTSR